MAEDAGLSPCPWPWASPGHVPVQLQTQQCDHRSVQCFQKWSLGCGGWSKEVGPSMGGAQRMEGPASAGVTSPIISWVRRGWCAQGGRDCTVTSNSSSDPLYPTPGVLQQQVVPSDWALGQAWLGVLCGFVLEGLALGCQGRELCQTGGRRFWGLADPVLAARTLLKTAGRMWPG